MQITIILVSSDESLIETTSQALDRALGYRLAVCRDYREARKLLERVQPHLLIADYCDENGGSSGILADARISCPGASRLLVASPGHMAGGAIAARDTAAYLFLVKPVMAEQLAIAIKRALEQNELSRRHRLLSRELRVSRDLQVSVSDELFEGGVNMSVKGGVSQFEKLVYASPQMAELVAEAKQAAATELPVLIHGETGTGKELLARAIHFNSSRMNSLLHVQNCGGISDETLQSELFGHVRGAFTGAVADRPGLFRAADGGTVFLDEISEVSRSFQVSLLRFLQEGEVKPLGADKVTYANVRVIAASNKSLEEMVERGEFRRDLYYRLKGFTLLIPPLRERPEDIAVLAEFFLEKYAGVVGRQVIGITRNALDKMSVYGYPGNVRELETEIRRMVAIADNGSYISERHMSAAMQKSKVPRSDNSLTVAVAGGSLKEMVENLERRVVGDVLERSRWNQSQAANALGLSRVGLANKIKRYKLQTG